MPAQAGYPEARGSFLHASERGNDSPPPLCRGCSFAGSRSTLPCEGDGPVESLSLIGAGCLGRGHTPRPQFGCPSVVFTPRVFCSLVRALNKRMSWLILSHTVLGSSLMSHHSPEKYPFSLERRIILPWGHAPRLRRGSPKTADRKV